MLTTQVRPPVPLLAFVIILALSSATSAQPAIGVPPTEPRQPGAIDSPPAWLRDAPFDVARFFAMPPAAENAAPLYIEAFAEFDGAVAPCFPPERRGAVEAAGFRWKRWEATWESWYRGGPDSVPAEQVDALLAEYSKGLRLLDRAQARPRCVFTTALLPDTPLLTLQASRIASRLLAIQAGRQVQRGDFAGALSALAKLFRLSRDVRPRGYSICQAVSVANDLIATEHVLPIFLASPRLQPGHCDRLLALLAKHEAEGLDPFATGIRADYLLERIYFHWLVNGRLTVASPDGRPTEQQLDHKSQVQALLGEILEHGPRRPGAGTDLLDDPAALAAFKAIGEQDAGAIAYNERILQSWQRDAGRTRAVLDDYARSLIAAPPTYPGRVAVFDRLQQARKSGPDPTFEMMFSPANYSILIQTSSRQLASLNAAKCQIALRRWQLTRPAPPTDLAAACRAAKLPAIPVDPYCGQPLRMVVDGVPIVYSVGLDGDDDHGRVDAEFGRKPDGDFLFRLPRVR